MDRLYVRGVVGNLESSGISGISGRRRGHWGRQESSKWGVFNLS